MAGHVAIIGYWRSHHHVMQLCDLQFMQAVDQSTATEESEVNIGEDYIHEVCQQLSNQQVLLLYSTCPVEYSEIWKYKFI